MKGFGKRANLYSTGCSATTHLRQRCRSGGTSTTTNQLLDCAICCMRLLTDRRSSIAHGTGRYGTFIVRMTKMDSYACNDAFNCFNPTKYPAAPERDHIDS